MRKPRHYEHTCHCSAYRFPHRFGGGRCTGRYLAYEARGDSCGGYSGTCTNCIQNEEGERECAVTEGRESPETCDAWQEFVATEGIRIYRINWK